MISNLANSYWTCPSLEGGFAIRAVINNPLSDNRLCNFTGPAHRSKTCANSFVQHQDY